MALVLKDRVKETTTTTGTGTYTLAGAVTGFEAFSSVGNSNTTYYACTDGTDFEVGIGTYTSSGTTLARTTILQSSNSDSAVSWSSGTKTIFCAQPAEKAVFLNADGDIDFDSTHRIKILSDASDPVLAIAGGGPNFIRFHDGSEFGTTTNAVDIVYRTTPNDLLIERASGENIAEFGGDDGHAALYFNDSLKLETVSGGIDVTGQIAATSLDISGDVDVDGTLEADAMTLNGTAITTTATLSTGISNNNVPKFTSGVADNDFLRVDGTAIEGRSASEVLSDIAAMPLAGGTFTGDVTFTGDNYNVVFDKSDDSLKFADNAAIKLGTGDDFSMLHNGSNTVFHDAGTGGFVLRASQHTFKNQAGTETNAQFTQDGAVELYHDNSKKLETTSGGIDVTGEVAATSLTLTDTDAGSSEGPVLTLNRDSSSPADNDAIGTIQFKGDNDAAQNLVLSEIQSISQDVSDGAEDASLTLQTRKNGSLTSFLNLSGASGRVNIQQELFLSTGLDITFEGATSNSNETTLTVTDPTADRTITLPNATGTVALTSDIPSSGISSGNVATFTSGAADNDFLRIDGTSIEGRSASEVLSDIGATTAALAADEATALAIALG